MYITILLLVGMALITMLDGSGCETYEGFLRSSDANKKKSRSMLRIITCFLFNVHGHTNAEVSAVIYGRQKRAFHALAELYDMVKNVPMTHARWPS